MKKWTCQVCGYAHQGDEAPERCPQCGASKAQFVREGSNSSMNVAGIMAIVVMIIIVLFSVLSCNSETTVNNAVTTTEFDLNRYLGKWYEVARFDHKFERGLTHCTAQYTLRDDGKIKVLNRGKKNGKWDTAEGKAKTTDTQALLRVSFFGPFYADYRILLLAPDYSYALVGSGSDSYLWILSRTPELTPFDRDTILLEAQNRGYDIDKLIWVEQK